MIVASPSRTKLENTSLEEVGALIFTPLWIEPNSVKVFGSIGFGLHLDEPDARPVPDAMTDPLAPAVAEIPAVGYRVMTGRCVRIGAGCTDRKGGDPTRWYHVLTVETSTGEIRQTLTALIVWGLLATFHPGAEFIRVQKWRRSVQSGSGASCKRSCTRRSSTRDDSLGNRMGNAPIPPARRLKKQLYIMVTGPKGTENAAPRTAGGFISRRSPAMSASLRHRLRPRRGRGSSVLVCFGVPVFLLS